MQRGINHIPCLLHLKDVNESGEWVALEGEVGDFSAVLALLESVDYDGQNIAEKESTEAYKDGIAAIRKNRQYLRAIGY